MKTYLPSVSKETITNVQEFISAWLTALGERAKLMLSDDRLVNAAMQHAIYLDSRTPEEIEERKNVDHASHYGRDWSTAHERVRRSGYALPENYPIQGNSIESNARNPDPVDALNRLLESEFHGPHLRGEGGYSGQVVFGVGNAGNDYVILTAPPV